MGGDRWGHGGDGGHVKGPGGQGAVRRGRQQPEAPPDPALPLRQARIGQGAGDQGLGPPGRAANSPRRRQTQLCPCVRRGQIMGPGTRGRGPRPGRQQAEAPPDPALPLRQARTGQGAGNQGLGASGPGRQQVEVPPDPVGDGQGGRQPKVAAGRAAAPADHAAGSSTCRQVHLGSRPPVTSTGIGSAAEQGENRGRGRRRSVSAPGRGLCRARQSLAGASSAVSVTSSSAFSAGSKITSSSRASVVGSSGK
ncbi:hypothetical protein M2157_003542 [Streptomyces sp. SAI-127]|nr:hypothetical protein [Streptomyces sp. SAI-127]